MERLHIRAAEAQSHALKATLEYQREKSDDAPPRKMLRTLKRVATASITCFETHKQLSSHQSFLMRKLSLRTYTKEDISEIRRVCENLVYIIQLPHDRGTYSTALRLLSTIASAPDPVAFLLLERHIHPILRTVLETSAHLPQQGSTALLLLLEHLSTRHQLSVSRHTIFGLAARETIDASQMGEVEKACSDLIDLVEDPHSEIWVQMMVRDLLALVAKHPKLGFVLLQDELYERVYTIANDHAEGVAPGKLSRRLARLAAEGSSEMASIRREVTILLSKSSLSSEEAAHCRYVLSTLLHSISNGDPKRVSSSIRLLEDVAKVNSPASRMLTEKELYSGIEDLWARGTFPIDALYRSVKELLAERLASARALVEAASQLSTIPTRMASQLVGTFQELLSICQNHEVYDEAAIEEAVEILLLAASSSGSLSRISMGSSLLDQYAEVWNDFSGAPRSRQVSDLLAKVRIHQARRDLQNANTLISRLKHTREWSGLDSDNIKPLVQTLLSCAADPELYYLHPVAIDAMLDLVKSPADCAAALLFPEFAESLKTTMMISAKDTGNIIVSKRALKEGLAALRIEIQVRDELPRISELSGMASLTSVTVAEEFKELVEDLVRLGREESASNNAVLEATLVRGLLTVATGRAAGRNILRQAGGYGFLSSHAFTPANPHESSYVHALHDLMHDTEATIDGLMQLSQLHVEDERRLEAITQRLVQICWLDLVPWATTRAIELLGSLTKRPEVAFMKTLRAPENSDPLRLLGNSDKDRIALPIGRILRTLNLA